MMDQDDRKLRDKPDQRKAEEHRLGSAVSPWYHTILLHYAPPPAALCDVVLSIQAVHCLLVVHCCL
jgi:hypothetical protein